MISIYSQLHARVFIPQQCAPLEISLRLAPSPRAHCVFLEGAVGIEPTSQQLYTPVTRQEFFRGVKLWVKNFTTEDLYKGPNCRRLELALQLKLKLTKKQEAKLEQWLWHLMGE